EIDRIMKFFTTLIAPILRGLSQSTIGFIVSFCLLSSNAWGQFEIGSAFGSVADVDGARIPNAMITLDGPLSARHVETATDEHGEFRFDNIPYGTYVLHIKASGFQSMLAQLVIASNVPVRMPVQLKVAVTDSSVTVQATDILNHETARTETIIDETVIKLEPTVVR